MSLLFLVPNWFANKRDAKAMGAFPTEGPREFYRNAWDECLKELLLFTPPFDEQAYFKWVQTTRNITFSMAAKWSHEYICALLIARDIRIADLERQVRDLAISNMKLLNAEEKT